MRRKKLCTGAHVSAKSGSSMDRTSIEYKAVVDPTPRRTSPKMVKMIPPVPKPKIATQMGHKEQLRNVVEDMLEDQGTTEQEIAIEPATQGLLINESTIVSEEVQ